MPEIQIIAKKYVQCKSIVIGSYEVATNYIPKVANIPIEVLIGYFAQKPFRILLYICAHL